MSVLLVMARPASIVRLCGTLGILLLTSACSDGTGTTTPTRTPASPKVTERYVGVLPVGGSGFYSFSVSEYGTVNVTLNSVGGTNVPSNTVVGLGLGIPARSECAIATTVNVTAGTSPQITGAFEPAVYCVRVADTGTLAAPANFDISIAHP